MAQITISEEHYQALLALAQQRGLTPDALGDALIKEQLTAADQLDYWGEDRIIETERLIAEMERPDMPPRLIYQKARNAAVPLGRADARACVGFSQSLHA